MALLEKHINLLDHALSSLWRRKGKNGAIVAVFTVVIFLLASFQLVTGALTTFSQKVLVAAPEITIQRMVAGRQESIPLASIEKIKEIFGIRSIQPRIWGYYFDETNGANYTVMGVPADAPGNEHLQETLSGETESFFPGKGEVLLGKGVLEALDLQGRKIFSFFRPDLTLKSLSLAGVFNSQHSMLTDDLAVMNLEDARDLFLVPQDRATDLLVTVANPSEINNIAKKIADTLPASRVLTRKQIQKTYQVIFGWRSGFASVLLLSSLVAFIILAWDKASGLSPEERREIAILKILGWETADILTVRFWEAMLVAGASFFIGCSLAYAHVLFFDGSLFSPLMIGWSVVRPPAQLIPDIHLADILLLLSFSVLPYLAATVVPAWRCASVPPDSVVR